MKALSVILTVVFTALTSVASADQLFSKTSEGSYQGFVKVAPKRQLYVDYVKAEGTKPTVVLLNGLTYSTRQWDDMVKPLIERGIGVVRYDMFGQGKTLLKYAPIKEVIPYQDQVSDLKSLLNELGVKAPYNLVGLSYGGGIAAGFAAAYPKEVKNVIMLSPYTQPLETQDISIRAQIQAVRLTFPMNPMSDDELYDFFLKQNIYTTYPSAEPIVLENPYKLDATFHLVQGIRKFRPVDVADTMPKDVLHLVIARQDQYIPNYILDAYWKAVPRASQASRLYVNGSEHKIPEAVPNFAAAWVYQILSGNPIYFKGSDFEGFPFLGTVYLGTRVIKVSE